MASCSYATNGYPYPSHVNAPSFYSSRLLDKANYGPWKEQMMCLFKSHDMLGFIDGTLKNIHQENTDPYKDWNRSNELVKGWIFGSLTVSVMRTVIGIQTANDVWNKLKTSYSTTPATPPAPTTLEQDVGKYVELCRAIEHGEWDKTERLLKNYKNALTDELNVYGERTLHVAVGNPDNISILEKLLPLIQTELLPALVANDQENALHYAAKLDNKAAAEMLVQKNPELLFMVDEDQSLPIHKAVNNFHKKTFFYLLQECKNNIQLTSQKMELHNPFEGAKGVLLINQTIDAGFLDVAYELLEGYPHLATKKDANDNFPLYHIAKKSDAYLSAKRYNFYQRFVYSHVCAENYNLDNSHNNPDIENQKTYMDTTGMNSFVYHVIKRIYTKFWNVARLHVQHIKQLHEDNMKHNTAIKILMLICEKVGKLTCNHDEHYEDAFIVAVENNTSEVIQMITQTFPGSGWTETSDGNNYRLPQLSIIHRSENAYNFLVHWVTQEKYLLQSVVDEKENNILHLAGRLAPIHRLNMVTGAALQMQRELQWFEEVKRFVHPMEWEAKNNEQQTPFMVFREEHKDLRQKGEEWIKKTADSYTITAALIITIVFAAAITVPGGNKGDTGKPNFETKASFIVFAVSDAISLFTSTTSLLLFLSILTARYAEEDFLRKLPERLILGLVMLFISVTTMMIAFSATLYIMFGQEKSWILIPVGGLTCLPIASFVTLQLPLLYDLISSTYGRGIFKIRYELIINITSQANCIEKLSSRCNQFPLSG